MNKRFTPQLFSEHIIREALKSEKEHSPSEKSLSFLKEIARTFTIERSVQPSLQNFVLN